MCGRFTQTKSREEVIKELGGLELPPLFHGRYNIAPTQKVAIIREAEPIQAEECVWGFENPRSGAPVINARAESLTKLPMFKELLATNRCLIPADGFYEWKDRQPYYFQLPNGHLFAFAGLWRNDRCVIITRAADTAVRTIHDRMPFILTPEHWESWLEKDQPSSVLSTVEGPPLTSRPVPTRVNSVTYDDPACLAPAKVQTDLSLFPNDG